MTLLPKIFHDNTICRGNRSAACNAVGAIKAVSGCRHVRLSVTHGDLLSLNGYIRTKNVIKNKKCKKWH